MKAANRYTFIDYENLKRIKLKPLETLSQRLYIIINSEYHSIPLRLVKKVQRLKCDVRWISAKTGGIDQVNLTLAFQVGKMHVKTPKNIPFVIISNDHTIDQLISCVTEGSRTCTRVTRSAGVGSKTNAKDQVDLTKINAHSDTKTFPFEDETRKESLKEKTINDTIRRLTISDKRPVDIAELKRYIARSNQEIASYLNIGDIIEEMIKRNVISVDNLRIVYNFLPA